MKIEENHLLAPYCTYQIGGPADYFVEASGRDELAEALEFAEERDMPFFVFGAGSNLLFDDAGFRGLVVRVKDGEVRVEGDKIFADAGVKMAEVVKAAEENGLSGMEAMNGLPGSVGGAVFGNAGCFGTETADVLESAEVYLPGEGVKTLTDLGFSYRNSRLKKEGGIVLSVVFALEKGEGIAEKMKEIARSRIQKQPPGLNTGSFFKNPDGDHAGRLIDEAGLKGLSVGKAMVSEDHANFFVNKGGATAAEVLELAALVVDQVGGKFGVKLEREIVFVPEKLAEGE